MNKSTIFTPAIVLTLWLSSLVNAAQLPDFSDLVSKYSPAVVKITTVQTNHRSRSLSDHNWDSLPPLFRDFFGRRSPRNQNQPRRKIEGMGSGFIISEDGYILTNFHVVDKADEITIRLNNQEEYNAEIIGKDELSDLALLKIDAEELPYLSMADEADIKVGSWVLAIGSPFGLDYSASAGIVSAIGRSLPNDSGSNYVPFIQTDVAINPGNSGGPLFNVEGKVIGVNSQIFTRSGGYMGLSFAIPSTVVQDVIHQLKSKGVVTRGYLGLVVQNISKKLALSFGLNKPSGALVNEVIENSPAEKSGIEVGDIIVKINNKPIQFSHDVPHIIGLIAPDTKIKATVIRKGKEREVTIKVGDLNKSNYTSNNIIASKLGINVSDFNSHNSSHSRLSSGVEIEAVLPNSPAEWVGIKKGDIIVQIGFDKVVDSASLQQSLEKMSSGEVVALRLYRGNRAYYYSIEIN